MAKVIVFDLRALQTGHENRGIGMVIKSVLGNLEDDVNKYLFYVFDSSNPINDLNIDLKIKTYSFVKTPKLKTVVNSPKDLLDSFKINHHNFNALKKYKPDVFLQFDFALGLPRWRRTKTLCVGYDLIPLIMKNQYLPSPRTVWNQGGGKKSRIKGMVRAFYYRLRARRNYSNYKRTDKILCISEATRRSFMDILHINSQKLITLTLAPVIPKARKINEDKIKKPYIFYIGGTDARKNVTDVIHSFNIARGRGQDVKLVLAGNEFKEVDHIPDIQARTAILDSPYKNDITLAGFVSDREKLTLYKHALAFIFCSTYEGFGLPVLEAQALGCPVISYKNSSIPEVASKSVYLVPTGDIVGIAENLNEISTRDRSNIIGEGIRFARTFSWKQYSSKLLDLINEDSGLIR